MVARTLLALLLSLFALTASAANIQAHVDRNPVAVNESFTLTFEADGSVDDDPDFSPLEALFEILNRATSSSVQIINGDMTRLQRWQLTLMARAPGNYGIPEISFGKDKSQALRITVQDAPSVASDQTGPIFLETELSPEQAYVQSQLIYTVRLLRAVDLNGGELTEPRLSGVEAIVQKLGEDKSYATLRDGVRYLVVERNYALFPQASGVLTVEPTVFTGQIVTGGRYPFNASVQTKRLASEARQVQIKPIPAEAKQPWLPARDLQLSESWPQNPPQFRVGEPVTRTLTLRATGIAAAQLPALLRELPEGLKQYPDKPTITDSEQDTGLSGTRQEKIAIMPVRPGRYELPGIEIPWWNTRTGQQEIARIPPRSIEVVGQAAAPGLSTAPMPAETNTTPVVTNEVAPDVVAAPDGVKQTGAGIWPWISLALGSGWLLSMLLWWVRTRRQPVSSNVAPTNNRPAHAKINLHALQRACSDNDAAACKHALLAFAGAVWRDDPPVSLGAVAARVDDDFAEAINTLNKRLYAPGPEHWDGSALYRSAERWYSALREQVATKPSSIAPLHPHRTG